MQGRSRQWRQWMCAWALGLCLAACATPGVDRRGDALFDDALFAPPSVPISAEDLFTLSPAMRRYLETSINAERAEKNRQNALVDALYSNAQLKLEYDASITRNAAEAFEARSGNCLSLVVMTAAFAKALGLQVQYQSIYSEQTLTRSDGIVYLSSHVNLTLRTSKSENHYVNPSDEPLTVDFIPASGLGKQRARVVTERTIIAMFLNNRAAEALRSRRFDDAYWWGRAAIAQDPTFLPAYNTVGVVYRRRGHLAHAERIFDHVLAREPGNTSPLSNLLQVYREQGRTGEAEVLAQRIAKLKAVPPFHYFDLGQQAMQDKNYPKARDLFAREVERAAYYHEFHAWLAAAYFELGDYDLTRKHLSIALANATTAADRSLYSQRLEALKPKARTLR